MRLSHRWGERGPEAEKNERVPPHSHPPCPHVNSGIYQFCTEIAAYILPLFFGFAAGSDSLRLHSAGQEGSQARVRACWVLAQRLARLSVKFRALPSGSRL